MPQAAAPVQQQDPGGIVLKVANIADRHQSVHAHGTRVVFLPVVVDVVFPLVSLIARCATRPDVLADENLLHGQVFHLDVPPKDLDAACGVGGECARAERAGKIAWDHIRCGLVEVCRGRAAREGGWRPGYVPGVDVGVDHGGGTP